MPNPNRHLVIVVKCGVSSLHRPIICSVSLLKGQGHCGFYFLGTLVAPVTSSIMCLLDSLSFSHIKIGSNPQTGPIWSNKLSNFNNLSLMDTNKYFERNKEIIRQEKKCNFDCLDSRGGITLMQQELWKNCKLARGHRTTQEQKKTSDEVYI